MGEQLFLNLSDDELSGLRAEKAWLKIHYRPSVDDRSFIPSLRVDGTNKAVGYVHSWNATYIFLVPNLEALKELRIIVRQTIIEARVEEKK